MDKLIIFNVWWAMASYCELWWKRIIIDIWSSEDFSPILDFLIPYAKNMWWEKEDKINNKWKKYIINQLIISHPHRDHLSDIENFDKNFYAELITTPNNNNWMWDDGSLNRNLVFWDKEKDDKVVYLKENLINWRTPPLKSSSDRLELYYIKPKIVEEQITPSTDYVNNVSLVCILNVNWEKVMLPWDVMESWTDRMLENNVVNIIFWTNKTETVFKNTIEKIDILVAPHHGLKSAYNENMLKKMKDLKLVVIPEKPTTEDDSRQIDDSYYSVWSWISITDLDSWKKESQQWIKTSTWHIIITEKEIFKTSNTENAIKKFLELN